ATRPTLEGTPGGDDWLVMRDGANPNNVDVFLNGNLIYTAPIASLTTLTIDALAGNDRLTVDYVNGDPLPSGGLTYDGGTGTDSLAIHNNSALSAVYTPNSTTSGDGSIQINGAKTIAFTSVAPIDYNVVGGSFTLLLPGANDVV